MTARYERKKNRMTNRAVLGSEKMEYSVKGVNGRPGVHKGRERREESDLDR